MRPITELRAETPGCASVIHFNNAGAALPPKVVLDRVVDHVMLEARIGGYEAAAQVADELAGVYDSVAALIGAHSDEIAVVDSATRAWLSAFTAIRFRPGDRIVTTMAEYSSNVIAMMAAARNAGAKIEVLPHMRTGEASIRALADTLDDDVRLVAVTHAPTNGGLLEPIQEMGALVAGSSALFMVDACQSIGQVPLDVASLQVDVLSATGRKYLRAPRGTGVLYVRRQVLSQLEPIHLDLHSAEVVGNSYKVRDDARRFELWEKNVAAVLGLGAAARYYLGVGVDNAWRRISALADLLRDELIKVPDVEVTDLGARKSGIVSFRVHGVTPSTVMSILLSRNINITVSRRSSTPWDMRERGLEAVNRASVHYYNDESEVMNFIQVLHSVT